MPIKHTHFCLLPAGVYIGSIPGEASRRQDKDAGKSILLLGVEGKTPTKRSIFCIIRDSG